MIPNPERPDPLDSAPPRARRLFLAESGWRIAVKVGSHREFCYMMAPGQDYYHRLYDGELFLHRGDERLCLSCADRRGLLADEPRGLRDSSGSPDLGVGVQRFGPSTTTEGPDPLDEFDFAR